MTKPLPTGCVKQNTDISWRTFNLLLEEVSFDYQIGHIYVIDIEFDHTKAKKRQIVQNEIYPSIIDPCERSVYQLLKKFSTTSKGNPKTYRATKKAHATMFNRKFQPMYLEQSCFFIKRAVWPVTKIYLHFTFELERFKRNFVLMNQRSRQKAKNSIEKDFYKLMNNSNFGYDCHNDLDNCQFVPIFDELQEIAYLKKISQLF